jgi:hypothetical protein
MKADNITMNKDLGCLDHLEAVILQQTSSSAKLEAAFATVTKNLQPPAPLAVVQIEKCLSRHTLTVDNKYIKISSMRGMYEEPSLWLSTAYLLTNDFLTGSFPFKSTV